MKIVEKGEYLAPEIEVVEIVFKGCIAQSYDGSFEKSTQEESTW